MVKFGKPQFYWTEGNAACFFRLSADIFNQLTVEWPVELIYQKSSPSKDPSFLRNLHSFLLRWLTLSTDKMGHCGCQLSPAILLTTLSLGYLCWFRVQFSWVPVKMSDGLSSTYLEARWKMNTVKSKIRDAATLILVARNKALSSHFDYRVLLLERGEKSTFMVSRFRLIFGVIWNYPLQHKERLSILEKSKRVLINNS